MLILNPALFIKDGLDNSDAFNTAWFPGPEGDGVADIPLAADAEHALFKFWDGLQEY